MNNFYNFINPIRQINQKLFAFIMLGFIILLPYTVSAQASLPVPMKPRTSPAAGNQTIYNIKGDFTIIGNTNMTLVNYNDNTNNNNINMRYVNIDNVNYPGLLNSSSATLQFSTENGAANPNCSQVVFAGLYWTGRYYGPTNTNPSNTLTVSGVQYRKDMIKFRHESDNTYHSIQASSSNFTENIYYPLGATDLGIFAAYADVTEYVQGTGEGAYYVADIALLGGTSDNTGYFGGWGLVVVYENDLMAWRNISVFDGYGFIQSGNPNYGDLTLTGFNAVQQGPVNIKIGVMAGEGDVAITGDQLGIRQLNSTAFTYLNHPNNTSTNFFNSSIYSLVNGVQPPRNPNLKNNSGIDISVLDVPNASKQHITNGQTSTTFRYLTTQDAYIIFNFVIAIDAYVPDPEAQNTIYSLIDKDGNPIYPDATGTFTAYPGTTIQYALQIRNKGTEGIDNMQIDLPIPYTTEFVSAVVTPYGGFVTEQPTFDISTGILHWDVGNLPMPDSANHLFATLVFNLKVTENCDLLVSPGGCAPSVVIDGTLSGTGDITGIVFDGTRFVYGFQGGECSDIPLHNPPTINIYAGDECSDPAGPRAIGVCLPATATSVPYAAIAQQFQTGVRFYDIIDLGTGKPLPTSFEYTATTNFPTTAGELFYAVPSSLNTTCYWTFTINIMPLPSFEVINNTEICSGDSINLKTLVYDAAPANGTFFFYSDAAATIPVDSIVKPTATTTYYARLQSAAGYGCVSNIVAIPIAVMRRTAGSMIVAFDVTSCSGNEIVLTASTLLRLFGTQFVWYSSQTSTTALATTSQFNIGNIYVDAITDTTFYVSMFADTYCENNPGDRKAVKVRIYPAPMLDISTSRNFLCGYQDFEINIDIEVGADPSVISSYEWYWEDPATSVFSLANGLYSGILAPEYYGNTVQTGDMFTYTPSEIDFATDSVVLRLDVATFCGVVSDTITLYTNVGRPDAIIKIIEQPTGVQNPCLDTLYTVKITESGNYGLADIVVVFNDWKADLINVTKAEYLFPVTIGGTDNTDWQEVVPFAGTTPYFPAILPDAIVLQTGDSILVRFTVSPDCGFYGGSNFLFELHAKDACKSRNMSVKYDTTAVFKMSEEDAIASYSLLSAFSTDLLTNEGNGAIASRIITWSVAYTYNSNGTPPPDLIADSIYFNIPTGFSLIAGSLKSTDGTDFYETVTPIETSAYDPLGTEYKIPIYPGLGTYTPDDTVTFEFQFAADENVACGYYMSYIEIIHHLEVTCPPAPPCTFYETRAGSYPGITVDLYSFVPVYEIDDTYYGFMENNMWGGTIRAIAQTEIWAGDSITFVFYADMNGNGIIDAFDVPMDTIMFITGYTPANDTANLYFGQITPTIPPIDVPHIHTVTGYQLLGLATGKHVCDDVVFPIATIFGDTIGCIGDTLIYYAPEGMWNYTFECKTTNGATLPTRIPLEGNSIFTPNDNAMRLVFTNTGKFTVSVRYMLPAENVLLNLTLMNVEVVLRPVLGFNPASRTDTTICRGAQVELTHFFTVTNGVTNVNYSYFEENPDGSYTELLPVSGQLLVVPDTTTVYRAVATNTIGGCEGTPLDFTIYVNTPPQILDVRTEPNCKTGTGIIQFEVSGNAPFIYTLNGGAIHAVLHEGWVGTPYLPNGTYEIWIEDSKNCTSTESGIVLYTAPEKVQAVDDIFYTYKNIPVDGNVLYNDFDLRNQKLTMVNNLYYVQNGMLVFYSFDIGNFTYYPDQDFVGRDSVRYQIQNPCGITDSAWLKIILLDDDLTQVYPPIALPDEYIMKANVAFPLTETITFEVRVNDSDPQGQTLSYPQPLTSVGNGFLTQNMNGTFNYSPNPGFTGVDVFTYEICNQVPLCASTHVHITVIGGNMLQYLYATDDYYTVNKYDTLRITQPNLGVLGNDLYPGLVPYVVVIDSPQHGKVFLRAEDGIFTYIPNFGYAGPDIYTYRLCDNVAVNCDTAFVYIFIVDRACPDSAIIVKKDTLICAGETVDLKDLILPESLNIDTIFFYSDRDYVNQLTSTIVSTEGYYYIRALNRYGCNTDDSLNVAQLLIATDLTITANDIKICTGSDTTIIATAAGVTNPVFYLYENQAATSYIASNSTGQFPMTSLPSVTTNTDTLFYVAVEGDNYCENLPGNRKPVKISIYPKPELEIISPKPQLCNISFFTIVGTLDAGTDLLGMTYVWERQDLPGTTFSTPTGLSPDVAGDVVDMSKTFTYVPNAFDRVNGKVILRATVTTPVCGVIADTVNLYITPQNPGAIFEIVEQPIGMQPVCENTVYTLKVTNDDIGGLSQISVTMNDWKASGITVTNVAYLFPVSGGSWENIAVDCSTFPIVAFLPDTLILENQDAVLVRFTVITSCEFYAGSDYLFSLNAMDACNNIAMATLYDTTGVYLLNWGGGIPPMSKYEISSSFNKHIIENEGGGSLTSRTVTWSVAYVGKHLETNFTQDSIFFNIPYGMSLVSVVGTNIDLGTLSPYPMRYDPLEGVVYMLPVYDQLDMLDPLTDTVKFDITFHVDESAACGDYWFYVEIFYEDSLMCGTTKCAFYETLAGSYQDLSVRLYEFAPYMEQTNNEYFGVMNANTWGGIFRILTLTDIFEGDSIIIKFYADMNNNDIVDAADIHMTTISYLFDDDFSANDTIPIEVYGIPTVPGKQLLALGTGAFICEDILMPLVTLFGDQELCRGDTMIYFTTPGMANYQYGVTRVTGSGALPTRIPLEGQTTTTGSDTAVRYIFTQPGTYAISARYQATGGSAAGQMLNRTLRYVNVIATPFLDYTGAADTTVCDVTTIELSHFFRDTVSANAGLTTFSYERLESGGSYTPIGSGSPFTVTPHDNTTYRVSATAGVKGCLGMTKTFTVYVLQPLYIELDDAAFCDGDSIDLYTLVTSNSKNVSSIQFYSDAGYSNMLTSTQVKTEGTYYARAFNSCGAHRDTFTYITVYPVPDIPTIITSKIPAYHGESVNLCDAIDMIPGITYTFYENPDKTGVISGCIIIYDTAKKDYYVTANNGYCESDAGKIMIEVPCPYTVSDEEGNIYKVTFLSGYCWTENLKTRIYPNTTDSVPFAKPYTCAGCPAQLDTIFGLLYTWYSAVNVETGHAPSLPMPVQGICPNGWHLPSQAEWDLLTQYSAASLKSTKYWITPLGPGTDDYGFDARPAGWYNGNTSRFEDLYGFAGWWASDASATGGDANSFELSYYCDKGEHHKKNKKDALSVRCVKKF